MQYFTILQYRLYSFNIQDDRSTRGLLARPAFKKKFPKSPIRPAGSHFCGASCGQVFEWTLIELRSNIIKKLLCLFSFLMVLSMCNLQKRLIRAAFWVLLQAIFTAQRLKLQERLLTINKRNIIWWNIYRDNNFHSRRQVLKCLKLKFMFWLSRLPGVCFFQEGGGVSNVFRHLSVTDSSMTVWRHMATSQSFASLDQFSVEKA